MKHTVIVHVRQGSELRSPIFDTRQRAEEELAKVRHFQVSATGEVTDLDWLSVLGGEIQSAHVESIASALRRAA